MRSAVLLVTAALACAPLPSRRPLPAIPPPEDVELLLPARRPKLPVSPGAKTFPTQPLEPGRCPGLPAGVLVSEPIFALLVDGVSERNRLRVEVGALVKLRAAERGICLQAEQLYLGRLAELESAVQSAQSWLPWKMGAAAVLGAMFMYVAARATR